MKIILKNCNNIDEAKIDIKENELNIKYAKSAKFSMRNI